jgi:transcriptional regulator with XRE-family HTH domain
MTEVLKRYWPAAGLTQEALAERAGLGARSIQALERGESKPRRETLRRLAEALPLGEGERARLLVAGTPAPRRTPAGSAVGPSQRYSPEPRQDPQAAPRHNLPHPPTALIGREVERAAVLALLAKVRLVTLTGSAGVGKTRLALAVASELVDRYPDGIWLMELAALAEEQLVARTALVTLATREEAGRTLLETLTEHLRDRRLLLVLDNCEHLVGACAEVAEAIVRRCPESNARSAALPGT